MTVVDLYTIQFVRDDGTNADELVPAYADRLCEEAEENLTDLLPAGYRARIRRWDHPDEGDDE